MDSDREKYFFDMSCAEVLIETRKNRGYENACDFANAILMQPAQYGRYELGRNFEKDTFYIILKHLEISFAVFFNKVDTLVKEKIKKYNDNKNKNKY